MDWRAQRSGSRFRRGNHCKSWLLLWLVLGAPLLGGCVNVKAPDKIIIGGEPQHVDAGRVPAITTVEEGRMELEKAYRNLQLLQNENRELARDKDALKQERDRYKQERDECRRKTEKSSDD